MMIRCTEWSPEVSDDREYMGERLYSQQAMLRIVQRGGAFEVHDGPFSRRGWVESTDGVNRLMRPVGASAGANRAHGLGD